MTNRHDTPAPAHRDAEPTQLDRIEAKVDQLLRRAHIAAPTPSTPSHRTGHDTDPRRPPHR